MHAFCALLELCQKGSANRGFHDNNFFANLLILQILFLILKNICDKIIKQEGNSNIDCIPRAGKPRSANPQNISQNALQLDYTSGCKPSVLPFNKR